MKFIAITIDGQIDRFLAVRGIRLAVVHRDPPNADIEVHWKDGIRKHYFGEEADCIYWTLKQLSMSDNAPTSIAAEPPSPVVAAIRREMIREICSSDGFAACGLAGGLSC